MNERPIGHAPGHARHDRLLVTRYAVGEAISAEAEDARHLVEQCSDCAALAEDIELLRTSISTLPTPRRTRNFRLTQAQAEQLRGSAFERFLRRLAAPRLALLRPVAGVAVAMGLTLAVVGGNMPLPLAMSAAPPRTTQQDTNAAGSAQEPRSTAAPPAGSPLFGAEGSPVKQDSFDSAGESAAPPPEQQPGASLAIVEGPTSADQSPPANREGDEVVEFRASDTSADTTRLLLIYGGVTLAMLSFAVLLLAWYARRRNEDPLLR